MRHDDDWALTLLAYAEGELSGQQRSQVTAHLVTCPTCQTDLAALSATFGLTDPAPRSVGADPSTSIAFLADVRRRAERAEVTESTAMPPKPGALLRLALLRRDQVDPVRWLLVALPSLSALMSPSPASLGRAIPLLVLGFVFEYLLRNQEAASHDQH